ncbi:hypothetical protein AC579_6483 [Pseudocercospora musae]|uniref:Cas1p 10 TM acyl transferase domain-containing protein n=1 Tax=Pseudocercospora musae TaxID=113226 RepID=A0A139IAW1_9PEZI|nr:hypothetical protein AC579_6483 [Pseudocercospora musae]
MFSELFIVTTVAVLALQHYIFDNDPYKCQSLIQTGHWLAGEWRPSGCGAVQYGRSLQTCTRHRKRNIVFAGDLQLEGTYYHFVQRMTTSKNKPVPAPRERDLHHESGSVSLAFLYDPHLNGSLLMNAAEAFRDQTPESPMLLTIGAANTASESASPEEPNWIQLVTLAALGLLLPVLAILDTRMNLFSSVVRPIVGAVASFGIAVLLIYIADRSHVFHHVRKDAFRYENGGMLFLVSLVLGIATVRRSQTGKLQYVNNNFLPREHSGEWKGWMQLVIIFYHYGQVAALPVWHFLRICVSSYLFLTGFGHTVFFLQKKDYSLRRFINIMVRLNLLAVTLAYTMRTSWVTYYYIPLCTIWFLILYGTLAVGRRHNSNTLFLLSKILIAALLMNKMLHTDGLREALLAFFVTMTKGYFPVSFFDKRVNNDRYIVFIGMAVAPLYLWLTDLIKTQSSSNNSLLTTSDEKIPSTRQHFKIDRFTLQH